MKKKIGVGLGVFSPPAQQSGLIIKIYHFASWPMHQSQHSVVCLAGDIIGLVRGTQLAGCTEGHYR